MLRENTTTSASSEENSSAANPAGVTSPQAAQTPQRRVYISKFAHLKSNTPVGETWVSWDAFAARITDPRYRIITDNKKTVQLLSFARFEGTRSNNNTRDITAAAMDFDDGQTTLETILQRIPDVEFIAYSTHNHSKEKTKMRVVLPLSRPVTKDEWPLHWPIINTLLGGMADQSTKDACRMSFLPSCPADKQEIAFQHHNKGRLLDPDELLRVHAARQELPDLAASVMGGIKVGKPDMNIGFSEGNRHGELTRRAGWLLGPGNKTQEEALRECLEWNRLNNPQLGEKEIEKTVASLAGKEAEKRKHQPPTGYQMRSEGLYFVPEGDETKASLLSGHFAIQAETRNSENEAWGILIEWRDHDGKPHRWAMPRSLLSGDGTDIYARLLDGGLFVTQQPNHRTLLKSYLGRFRCEAKIRCVPRIGWHGSVYVMPDKVYGKTPNETVILQTLGKPPEFKTTGTLQGWREQVAAKALGNSRLTFALSVGFAGPLLFLLGEESGGFHFVGPSSIGKSTGLNAAASVWGSDSGSWRTTDNAAENLAVGASDGLLALDEIGQGEGKAVDAMVYMLANGQAKRRSSRDGGLRASPSWRIIFLSTGEVGIKEKIAEANKRVKAGQAVRVIEIPADAGAGYGLFENLHGAASGDVFTRQLNDAIKAHHGHAIGQFLEQLTNDPVKIRKAADDLRKSWRAQYTPHNADGQVTRAAGRFALVAAAGELAIQLGIVPLPQGEAAKSAYICFQAWLARRGGIEAGETTEGMAQVRNFLEKNGSSRFEILLSKAPTPPANGALTMGTFTSDPLRIINQAGYRELDENGHWVYYITPEVWKREVCEGFDPGAIADAMFSRGMMLRDADTRRKTKMIRPPGRASLRVYAISAKFMSDDKD